ncbi:MAG: hypothetical protein LN417_00615, partial [Candidatus Thermoplasmatota archaeon]|nr:hypothetical protein [Candidatus Thermoplasmatota archaeon]
MAEIEVFTASCPLCKETLEIIERVKCGKCTVTEYNLFQRCEDKVCLEKAKKLNEANGKGMTLQQEIRKLDK